MAKQLLEINKFMNGTVTTPDATDTPEQSASFSINLDSVNKDGVLQGSPINLDKLIKDKFNSTDMTAYTGTAVDIDKAKVIRGLRDDGTVSEDVVYWEDDTNKLNFISNVDKNDTSTRLNHTDTASAFPQTGNQYVATNLKDVAMEAHNKEVHIGLGQFNNPQWVGYTNHKGLESSAKILISEDAEVRYPSSLPYMHKIVRGESTDSYFYGIQKGGNRIWKIDGSSHATTGGTSLASSAQDTFISLQSIASDPVNGKLYVLDQAANGLIHQIDVDDLNEIEVTYTLPSTYPGPSETSYSDIEYTNHDQSGDGTAKFTNGKLWLASHYDGRTGSATSASQFLWRTDYSASNITLTSSNLVNQMPRMSGGDTTTIGTWVQINKERPDQGQSASAIAASDFSSTNNNIKETFPLSLIKHPGDNSAIYWLARYVDNDGDDVEQWTPKWLYKSTSSIAGGDNDSRVESVSITRSLCLHRIKRDHSAHATNAGGDFVPLYHVYHPNGASSASSSFSAINIDSVGIDNDGSDVYFTIGDKIERLTVNIVPGWTTNSNSSSDNLKHLVSANAFGPTTSTTYNVTPTNAANRTGVSVNFGYVPSTSSTNTGNHAYATDFIVLSRQDGTSGFDKLAQEFTTNAVQTHYRDHNVLGITIADASNTGELLDGYTYFYKASMVFDGYQETPLSLETFREADHTDGTNNTLSLSIPDKDSIPKRASGVKIYRAESQSATATLPTSFYRLVKVIPFSKAWQGDGSAYTFSFEDSGTKGASFEAESGLPETLEATLPRYSLSTSLNNQHYIGKCWHEGYVDDASSYIFVSKVGKFDTFDWLIDFIKLPTVPTALTSFSGRVYAFDELNTYRMRGSAGGQGLYIEDIFEGVGCLNDDAVVSTDFGLFFADNNNIYQHNGRSAEPIGEAIVRGDSTYSWQNRDTSYYTRAMYDAKRRTVYFTFKAGSNYYAWGWNIPRKRWDMLSFGNTEGTLQPKGYYLLNDTSMNVGTGTSVVHFLGESKDNFTVSSNIANNDATVTVGSTSTIKPGMYVYGAGIPANATVLSITAATTFELSANATAATTGVTLTFSSTRQWTWVSKDLTMGNDTQQKVLKELLLNSRIKANFTTNSTKPSAGNQVSDTIKNGTFRMGMNTKATNLKVRLDSNAGGDELGAVGILFRLNRIPS